MTGRRCRKQVAFKQSGEAVVLTCDLREKHDGDHWLALERAGHPGERVGWMFWHVDARTLYVSEAPTPTRRPRKASCE
jgi:hypothetical protein